MKSIVRLPPPAPPTTTTTTKSETAPLESFCPVTVSPSPLSHTYPASPSASEVPPPVPKRGGRRREGGVGRGASNRGRSTPMKMTSGENRAAGENASDNFLSSVKTETNKKQMDKVDKNMENSFFAEYGCTERVRKEKLPSRLPPQAPSDTASPICNKSSGHILGSSSILEDHPPPRPPKQQASNPLRPMGSGGDTHPLPLRRERQLPSALPFKSSISTSSPAPETEVTPAHGFNHVPILSNEVPPPIPKRGGRRRGGVARGALKPI